MADFYIREGDRLPELQATLTDATGAPVDLTTATAVRFHLKAPGAAIPKVDADATVIDAAEGQVSYQWVAGDTDTAGAYFGEFQVIWPGVDQTFPNDGYIDVSVTSDLDSLGIGIASLAETKDALNIDRADTSHDNEIQRYVDAADAVIEDIVGPVVTVDYDEWYDGGYGDIVLRHWPVIDVTAVTEYAGATPTDLTVAASPDLLVDTSYVFDQPTGILYRRTGTGPKFFANGSANVRVRYTAGRFPIPANIKLAALEFIRHNYQLSQQSGRPAFGGAGEEGPWVPSGFAIPTRVYELLAPDARDRLVP